MRPVELPLGTLPADDAGIFLRSPESLDKMMSIIMRASRLFGVIVSDPYTESMCMRRKAIEHHPIKVDGGGQV